jgi:hypothetical protein
MVISRRPIRDSLWATGLHQDQDVMIRRGNRLSIHEELLLEYILNVFIPYVANLCVQPQFENWTAIHMMDSALRYVSELVLRLLGQNKIMAIVFPVYMTNIFQALDLVFFFCSQEVETNSNG